MNEKPRPAPLSEKVKNLPESAGVYRFVDRAGTVLYIGKAKNLRKRVENYFSEGRDQSYRIRLMVNKSADVLYTLTYNESEALLLENNLIKNHQPRYNINLKDGKSYPYICIKNERFPRVFPTRKKFKDGSEYFGPYASVKTMQAMLTLLRENYLLRTCNLNLSAENIQEKKFKICLEYQIGNCGGPCEGLVGEESYMGSISSVRKILNGNISPVLEQMKDEMSAAAADLEFEKAEKIRKRIERLGDYKRRSSIFSEKLGDLEVVTLAAETGTAIVNHFRVRNGAIVQTHAFEIKRNEESEDAEILASVISKFMSEDPETSTEWLSNFELSHEELPSGVNLNIPIKGEKKILIELSLKNCRSLLEEKTNILKKHRKLQNEEALQGLRAILKLNQLPLHIECFDNSNFQGSHAVASLVVFKNGIPSKKDYRHFKIKTVEGPDDFASMKEIVSRRYNRLLVEKEPLPDLIMVDGGKGQLSSAAEALDELGLRGNIPLIGIAKRLEEIFRMNDPFPLHIDKRSPALKLLQVVRNEAHRFAITFHRDTRSKAAKGSSLEKIEGIGPATAARILKNFKSVKKLKKADPEELIKALGQKTASLLLEAIKKEEV